MESPERSESIPAPVDQGSPFFKYLCGLSPIKPSRSVHVVQTYAELSLPPPPAIFTSPANPQKCGGRSKRGLVVSRTASTHVTVEALGILGNAWGGDKENQPNESYMAKGYAAAQVDASHPSSHASPTPTKFEYGDVSDYLADPPEGGLYAATSSSQVVAKSLVVRSSKSPENYRYHDGDHHNVAAIHEETVLANLQDRADSCDEARKALQQNLNSIQKCQQMRDLVKTDRRESSASRTSGPNSDHEGSGISGPERSSRLDQETAAMAFLLAGDVEGEGDSRNDWAASQSALSAFSKQQTPDFSAIGRLSRLARLKTREDFELAASKALENQRKADAESREEDSEGRKDSLVGDTGGQRGVRRRCLDFETSVRRKSMGGSSSRKNFGLRSKALPGSSALTSTSSIPPSILCERAVATSDATNSAAGTSGALESHSDISVRPECTSSGSRVLSPGPLRVSRCSSVQRNADKSSDQCPTDPARPGRDCNNSSSSVGIPSGIGLHLNSLTGSISFSPTNRDFKQAMGITSTTKGAVASLLGMPCLVDTNNDNRSDEFGNGGLSVGAGSNHFSMGPATSNFGTGVVISVMERSRVTLREAPPVTDLSRCALKPTTLQSLTGGGRQALEGSRPLKASGFEKKFAYGGGKKRVLHQDMSRQINVDHADDYESPQSSKKRKSPSASGEKSGEGCKRCNCKKSKCLKLYCECFAAGTYCVGSCTCHDCFNKPEHEETVLSTRQQIESRNPLAFAPKIIHSGDTSPKRGEEVIETPASARHKRGCNCKKSLCLKKYCECYQAGVGCSEGCRCEGCKNMYGRKEAIEDSDDKETASDPLESGSIEDELELSKPGYHSSTGNMDQHRNNGKDLSPITPSFQYTGQGRSVGRVRSAGKKCSSSPLSQLQSMAKPPRSPVCATRSSMKLQSYNNAQRTPDLQHMMGLNSPISTPKLSRGNQLSPRWDGLGDICTLTPLPQPPLRPTPASISTLDRTVASPSFSCRSIEPISSYQPDKLDSVSKSSPPPFQQAPDHSPLSSFELRNPESSGNDTAPCTATLSSSYLGSDTANAGVARSAHLPYMCEDDDTPDFLKYTDCPVVTKSGSPKQKRVSPPHFEGIGDRNRDVRVVFDSPAGSSPGLRSGRKFILQALPSLPPVMPLLNPSQSQAGNCPNQV
ncbi:unnamed protein product [Calypogeia fissa]